MKQIITFGILCLFLVFLVGCGSNSVPANNDNSNLGTNAEQKEAQSDSDFKEEKGIFTDTVSFGEGDSFYGEIKKHKSSKTAEVEALMAINDTDEVTEGFDGEPMYMAPVLVNLMCNVMNLAIFAPEELASLNDGADAQSDSDMWDYLEGYTVTELAITFIDAEDKSQIAKCASTGKDKLEFAAYRKYDPSKSFFGAEIGVLE